MESPEYQLQSLHAMLAAGHRCVRLERRSLLSIGLVGGFLCAATESVITNERFPDLSWRAAALLAWLGAWMIALVVIDGRLTRRARALREETLPFAQAQITRAWSMLLGMGCFGSLAMMLYGGGAMVYVMWILLLGLGIYLFGLFARPLIEWIGLSTILLGVVALVSGLPYGATRWLCASCFAIGMPLAGWLDGWLGETTVWRRVPAVIGWLVVVVSVPLMTLRAAPTPVPSVAPVAASMLMATAPSSGTASSTVASPGASESLAAIDVSRGEQVLRFERGARLPLRIDLDSPILEVAPDAELIMTLTQPMEVALRDGVPDGRYRVGDGTWHSIGEGILQLQIDRVAPRLGGLATGTRPEVRMHARFGGAEFER